MREDRGKVTKEETSERRYKDEQMRVLAEEDASAEQRQRTKASHRRKGRGKIKEI